MNKLAISTLLRLKPLIEGSDEISLDDEEGLSLFDSILEPSANQLQCYQNSCASQTVPQFLNGKNCTLFCYGQTGSGKTHTLFGPPNSFHQSIIKTANESFKGTMIPSNWGIFPRLVLDLLASGTGAAAALSATAVEIYMDNCYDLMSQKQKIAVEGFGRSSKISGRGGFIETTRVQRDTNGRWVPPRTLVERPEGYGLKGAQSTILKNVSDLVDFLQVVEATRTSKAHNLNTRSSRSHCVITLLMPSQSPAKYILVDLAGSERIVKSGTIHNEQKANEAKNINQSLSTLQRCIIALAKSQPFVPYRDSVLTMLLKQGLGGPCITSVIITATRDRNMQSETHSSLQFGARCSNVSNRRQSKESFNPKQFVSKLWHELESLDAEIAQLENDGKSGGINVDFPNSLRQTFMRNLERYKKHKIALDDCKQKIKAGEANLEKLMSLQTYQISQVRILQGILVRSYTTGIWKDPTPSYMNKIQQRIDILSLLKASNEDVTSVRMIDTPLTLAHLLQGFTG